MTQTKRHKSKCHCQTRVCPIRSIVIACYNCLLLMCCYYYSLSLFVIWYHSLVLLN